MGIPSGDAQNNDICTDRILAYWSEVIHTFIFFTSTSIFSVMAMFSKIVQRQQSISEIRFVTPWVDRRHFIFGEHELRDREWMAGLKTNASERYRDRLRLGRSKPLQSFMSIFGETK